MQLPRWLLSARDKQPSRKTLGVQCQVTDRFLQKDSQAKAKVNLLQQAKLDDEGRVKEVARVSDFTPSNLRHPERGGEDLFVTADYYGYWTHLTRLGRIVDWWRRRGEERRESEWEREQIEDEGLEAVG